MQDAPDATVTLNEQKTNPSAGEPHSSRDGVRGDISRKLSFTWEQPGRYTSFSVKKACWAGGTL